MIGLVGTLSKYIRMIPFIGCYNLLKALWQLDEKKIGFVGFRNESAIPDPRLQCHEVLAFLMI